MRGRTITAVLFVGFVATVYGANWALHHYGIVPIGFGLTAPAGVYFAGLAFGIRDALHERAGRQWVLLAVAAGATLTYALGDAITIPGGQTSIAIASCAAFAVAELADLVVYSPLRERQWTVAVVLSNLAGALIDSALFLWLAFGSLDHMVGQVVGKMYMVAPAILLVWIARCSTWPPHRRRRLATL